MPSSLTGSSIKISFPALVHSSIQNWLLYNMTDQASMPHACSQLNRILTYQVNNSLLCLDTILQK